jgi:VanZ family protein
MNRARWLALLWTLFLLAACTVPGTTLPSVSLWEFDKLIHFALFAGFGWLWMQASTLRWPRRMALVFLAGVAFALLTEWYQGLLPWPRTPDPLDALADSLGVLAGVVGYRLHPSTR